MSGIILYHGTIADFNIVDLAHTRDNKDFGKGFYLTTDYTQAYDWAYKMKMKAIYRGYNSKGYIYSFKLSIDRLKQLNTHKFTGTNKAWLEYIIYNRDRKTNNHQYDYDVVIGKVADANAQGLIDAYTLLTEKTDAEKEKLLKRLKAERLKDQYCFKTAKAITLLNDFGNVKRKEFECYQKQIDSI